MLWLVIGILAVASHNTGAESAKSPPSVRKVNDITIFSDDRFYCAFPSIVTRRDGELIVAFRRAPERRKLGEAGVSHTDANSYLVLVRSQDGGKSWSSKPELISAHPFGGSQDPCMVQLRDGSLICSSYAWAWIQAEAVTKMKKVVHYGNYAFLGGYLVRSGDGGHTWSAPIEPAPCAGETVYDIFGKPVPAYNRGAMCEGKDGRLYWIVASNTLTNSQQTETHLMISPDKGQSWQYSCPIAQEPKFSINESSLYQTPKGDFVAFMRTEGFNDHTLVARSSNNGKSFEHWIDTGFQGHPHHAIQLPDKRVLLVYGYRHVPYGIRARVLDPECTRFDTEEIVLRDDGGNGDLGYPWVTLISKKRALAVYYFNKKDGTRHIAGTFLEIR
jgi:hypothetical protein